MTDGQITADAVYRSVCGRARYVVRVYRRESDRCVYVVYRELPPGRPVFGPDDVRFGPAGWGEPKEMRMDLFAATSAGEVPVKT